MTDPLQAARNAAGLSQSQAALAMGRPVSTLRKWEQGVNVPHPTIQAVALAALKSAKRPKRKAENALHELPPPRGSECNQDATGG